MISSTMAGNGQGAVMRLKPRNYFPAFKAKVALAAVQDDWTPAELAQQYDVHQNQITQWKRQLVESSAETSMEKDSLDRGSRASNRSAAGHDR